MKDSDSYKQKESEKRIMGKFDDFEGHIKSICSGYKKNPSLYNGDASEVCNEFPSLFSELKQYISDYFESNSFVKKANIKKDAEKTMDYINDNYHKLSVVAKMINSVIMNCISLEKSSIERFIENDFSFEEPFKDISNSDLRQAFYGLEQDIRKIESVYNNVSDSSFVMNACSSLSVNLADSKGYVFSFNNQDHAYGSKGIVTTAKENMFFVNGNFKRLVDQVGSDSKIINRVYNNIEMINTYVAKKTKELETMVV